MKNATKKNEKQTKLEKQRKKPERLKKINEF